MPYDGKVLHLFGTQIFVWHPQFKLYTLSIYDLDKVYYASLNYDGRIFQDALFHFFCITV